MTTDNTSKIPSYCDGCKKHCKYGYTRTHDGKIIPTINGTPQEYFIRPDGNITYTAVSTPTYAQQFAHIIAQTCNNYIKTK